MFAALDYSLWLNLAAWATVSRLTRRACEPARFTVSIIISIISKFGSATPIAEGCERRSHTFPRSMHQLRDDCTPLRKSANFQRPVRIVPTSLGGFMGSSIKPDGYTNG